MKAIICMVALFVLVGFSMAHATSSSDIAACQKEADVMQVIATERDNGVSSVELRKRIASMPGDVRQFATTMIMVAYGSDQSADQLTAVTLEACLSNRPTN